MALVACGARTPLATGGEGASDAGADAPFDARADAKSDAATVACGAPGGSVLAASDPEPDTIVLADGFLYWHTANGISRVPVVGGPVEPLDVSPSAQPFPDLSALAVGGGYVFFADQNAVDRVTVSGGAPESLFSLPTPGVAASATRVHAWPRNGPGEVAVRVLDFGAQSFSSYTVAEPPNAMFFVGEEAYVAADPGVYVAQPQASSAEILSGQTATDVVVDADAENVYFTSDDGTNGARVIVLSQTTHQQSDVAGTSGAFALAMDATDLFFTDADGLRVRRVDGKTGPVEDVANDGPDFAPVDLVVDDSCVYWTSASRAGETQQGRVMVAPKR